MLLTVWRVVLLIHCTKRRYGVCWERLLLGTREAILIFYCIVHTHTWLCQPIFPLYLRHSLSTNFLCSCFFRSISRTKPTCSESYPSLQRLEKIWRQSKNLQFKISSLSDWLLPCSVDPSIWSRHITRRIPHLKQLLTFSKCWIPVTLVSERGWELNSRESFKLKKCRQMVRVCFLHLWSP